MGHLKYCMRILMGLILLQLILVENAYAYIDPGVGSVMFQLIIAGLLGGMFVVKAYWKKIKSLLLRLFSRRKNSEKGNKA